MEIDYEKQKYFLKIIDMVRRLKERDYAKFPPEKYNYLKQVVCRENKRLRKEGQLRPVELKYSLSLIKKEYAIVYLTKDGKPKM